MVMQLSCRLGLGSARAAGIPTGLCGMAALQPPQLPSACSLKQQNLGNDTDNQVRRECAWYALTGLHRRIRELAT